MNNKHFSDNDKSIRFLHSELKEQIKDINISKHNVQSRSLTLLNITFVFIGMISSIIIALLFEIIPVEMEIESLTTAYIITLALYLYVFLFLSIILGLYAISPVLYNIGPKIRPILDSEDKYNSIANDVTWSKNYQFSINFYSYLNVVQYYGNQIKLFMIAICIVVLSPIGLISPSLIYINSSLIWIVINIGILFIYWQNKRDMVLKQGVIKEIEIITNQYGDDLDNINMIIPRNSYLGDCFLTLVSKIEEMKHWKIKKKKRGNQNR